MQTQHIQIRTCISKDSTYAHVCMYMCNFQLSKYISFDKLHVCFTPPLVLELLGQFSVIALGKEYYYRELIASCQSH